MKKINKLVPFLFLLTILIATSCLKDNETNPYVPNAAMRMVNAYTDADAIIFTNENNYIAPPNTAIRYSEYTRSLVLFYPGDREIKVYNNNNKLVSETSVQLKDSSYYTSFVYGNTENAKNLITKDVKLTDLANTSAASRFFNLASNVENVNVSIDNIDNKIYSNIAPEVVSEDNESVNATFKPQVSGKHKIIITDASNNVLVEREYDFRSTNYYSLILIGDKTSTTKPLYLGVIQQ